MSSTLPSGFKIPADALPHLLSFATEEYPYYDGIDDRSPNEVLPVDVLATLGVNSFIQNAASIRHIHREMSHACTPWLKRLPVEAALTAEQWPEGDVASLFAAACSIHQVGMARATKVLHRKRRNLIPMLDNVLIEHYVGRSGLTRAQVKDRAAAVGMEALNCFRGDLLAGYREIQDLRGRLAVEGFDFTPVRTLEILTWIEKEPNGFYRP